MGSNKLGSLLELEDLDAIAGKEKELVRHIAHVASVDFSCVFIANDSMFSPQQVKLVDAQSRVEDATAVLTRLKKHVELANEVCGSLLVRTSTELCDFVLFVLESSGFGVLAFSLTRGRCHSPGPH